MSQCNVDCVQFSLEINLRKYTTFVLVVLHLGFGTNKECASTLILIDIVNMTISAMPSQHSTSLILTLAKQRIKISNRR